MIYKRRAKRKAPRRITPALKTAMKSVANGVINRRAELKHFTSNLTVSVSNAGSVNPLTQISQAITDLTRVGDQLEMQSINLGYQIVYADTTNIVRVTFLQWYPNSTPTVGDIFADTSTIGLNLGPFVQDAKRAKMYKILSDELIYVNANKLNYGKQQVIKNFRKRLALFAATTQAGGHIYVILSSDSSAVSHPTFTMGYGISYYDL